MDDNAHLTNSLVKRLGAAINDHHERLDASIKAADAFADRERYGRFLQIQQIFHRDLDALYFDARLGQLIPGLSGGSRLRAIEQDLSDLGLDPIGAGESPEFDRHADVDLSTALGWLYVAEGSKLGATVLLRWAGNLGLSGSFGARHLAPPAEGLGLHWKTFSGAVDSVDISTDEEARVIAGSRAAFARFQELVYRHLARTPGT